MKGSSQIKPLLNLVEAFFRSAGVLKIWSSQSQYSESILFFKFAGE
jgi:hypothetical protein